LRSRGGGSPRLAFDGRREPSSRRLEGRRQPEGAAQRVAPVKRFRGGLVFKAHRLLYHSTLGLRVIKKKKKLHLRLLITV